MARQQDALRQFTKLTQQLMQEREEIRSRLHELNAALADGHTEAAAAVTSAASPAPTQAVNASGLGMREAIQHVTASNPLQIRQIVEAVQQIGYKFKSSNPANSVGAYLYGKEGKKHFKKSDAGFSPLRGGTATKAISANKPGKRKMSAAGRRAIAAGARKRWAAYNATKKK